MVHKTSQLDRMTPLTSEERVVEDTESGLGPIQGVSKGASSVLADAFDLGELQIRLMVEDATGFGRRAKFSILGLVIVLGLLIASLPVLASGLAQWMAWGLEWPTWTCQLIVGFTFAVLGLLIGYGSVKSLRSSLAAFEPSQREAAENMRWLRQALSRTFST